MAIATIDQDVTGPSAGAIDNSNRRRGVLRDQILASLVSTKWTTTLSQASANAMIATANMVALTAVPWI